LRMVRTIITPETNSVQLAIPKDYVGKEIEITILALDELAASKPISGTMADFWDIISDDTANTLHKDVEQARNEWE
jgi:protein tyrosine phosphatase